MREMNRWGLAAGLAAALAFAGTARAQSQTTTGSAGSGAAAPSTQSDQSKSQEKSEGTGSTGSMGSSSSQQSGTGSATGSEQSGMSGMSSSGQQGKLSKTLQTDLEKLHAANQAEIHMGQMAEQQAQSPEVKDYGKKLTEDHQKLDEKLQSEASNLGVNLEGQDYQKALKDSDKNMQKLQGKSGASFDKEFLSMAEKDHKKDQKDAEKAAKQARKDKQETLASLFAQADTGMKAHLDEAKRISKSVEKEGSQRQGRRAPETGTGTTGGTGSTSGSSQSQQQESGMGSSSGTTGKGSGSSATPH